MIKEEIRKYMVCDMCKEDVGTYYYKTNFNDTSFELCGGCSDKLESSFIFLNKTDLSFSFDEVLQYSIVECRNSLQKEE